MTQVIALFLTGLVSIGLLLVLLQLRFKKVSKINEDGKLKSSFSLWIGAIFLSTCIILSKALTTLNEGLNIYKSFDSPILNLFKIVSIFIGLSFLWIFIISITINLLSNLIFEDRKEKQELEIDNYNYFILKSLLLLGSTIALLQVFENLLKIFLPVIQTPFYH